MKWHQLLPYRLKQRILPQQQTSEIIWFVSFPKSGKTWLQLMTAYVESSLSGLDIREFLGKHPKTYFLAGSNNPLPFVTFSHGYRNFDTCKSNFFASDFYEGKRVVLLIRDPRDVLVSHYYYQKWHYELFLGTLSQFIHYPYKVADDMASRYGIAPIINYLNTWAENRHILEQLHIIRYEDIKADIRTNFKEYLDFLRFPISQNLLSETISYGSFDNMRKLELSNELDWYSLGGANSEKGFKTRKGKKGHYRQEMSAEDLEFVNRYIDTHLHEAYSYYYSNSALSSNDL